MIEKIRYSDHEEWLAIRNRYIGGSDAGAVCGMNDYKGPFAVWMEKTGRAEPFEGNAHTKLGTFLEQYVSDQFEEQTGKKVRRDNHTMVNDLYPWACANVDRRIVGENALLECKTTSSVPNIRKFANGEYPDTWYCQCTHYMAVTGAERVYLAVQVLSGSKEFLTWTIDRDVDEITALMAAEERFWQHVIDNTPPEPAATDADAVKDVYPAEAVTDADIDLTAESDLLDEYQEAVADLKQAEARKAEIQNRICVALGDNARGHNDKWRVTWAAVESSRFDKKAFQKARPDIDLAPYHTISVSRRFDVKAAKINGGIHHG